MLPTKKYASLGSRTIAYLHAGNGPPLILIHGFPTSSSLWKHIIPKLARHYSVYALDLMGFGASHVSLEEDIHLGAQAKMLCDFMQINELEDAIIVGHDLGGGIAQLMGIYNPERVKRLVLASSVGYNNFPVNEVLLLSKICDRMWLLRLLKRFKLLEIWAKSRFFGMRKGVHQKAALTNEAIEEYLIRPYFSSNSALWRLKKIVDTQHENAKIMTENAMRLKDIELPTLIIWGENDCFIPPMWGKQLLKDISGAQKLSLIPHAGHFFQEEKSDSFSELILEWLKKDEETPSKAPL